MAAEPNIVFLYTELAGYIRAGMERLASCGVGVHVMAYPVNAEAPFDFDNQTSKVRYYNRTEYSHFQLSAWMEQLRPGLVVCSGWIDRGYISICRQWRHRTRTVLALDNPYPDSLRGLLGLWRARWTYKAIFSHAWVPGMPQVAYARAMGFAESEIHQGFYVADMDSMSATYARRSKGSMRRRFLYVGRYVDFKGVNELWSAFAKLDEEGWELHCAGTGPLYPQRPEMPGLHHHGFVQPSDLGTFVGGGGIFVLPSHREPWGVVVQEMASAGLPLICSSAVGATSAFLKEGVNGLRVPPRNPDALCRAMQSLACKPIDELEEMGRQSAILAASITQEQWCHTALQLLQMTEPKPVKPRRKKGRGQQ